ncbi:MAG: NAD(P)-binding protein [Planctomycetes bacterium]|nr:NAD(P)-binding protein [Planctomycetota bacterium]
MSARGRYVVIGAGLAGLTAAERLAAAGQEVTVLEQSPHVGGLARSFAEDGFIFDVGPHYFFLNVRPDVSDYVRRLVKGPYRELGFRISAHFGRREIAWPPNFASIFKLPPRAVVHYLKRILRNQHPSAQDFRGFSSFLYGPAMYETFFGPYIEKKLPMIAGERLHRDWWILARRTIDNELDLGQDRYFKQLGGRTRQVDQGPPPLRKKILKAIDMLLRTWSNMTSQSLPQVLYPAGGIGMIAEGIREEFERQGGTLLLGAGAARLVRGEDGALARVEWDGGAVDRPDHVIWTGSIHQLADQLGFERAALEYLSIALVYVKSRRPIKKAEFLYTYFADPDLVFNRLYFPTRASAGLAPVGMDSVCAEVSPQEGGATRDADALGRQVVDGLVRLGYLQRADVLDVRVREAPDSYPVYPLDYLERLGALWSRLKTVPNLTSLGRTGQFYYNNMALTMCLALDFARRLLGKP